MTDVGAGVEPAVLSAGDYLTGTALLLLALGAVVVAARAIRHLAVPGWVGLPARLAETVAGVVVVLAVGQALGSVGALRPGATLTALLVIAVVAALVRHRTGLEPPARDADQPMASPAVERAGALVLVTAVGAQWATHVADALSRGMVHPDTLWYHAPFSVRFLQTGGFGELVDVGYDQSRWFPMASELLHALVVMPYQRDLLAPLLSIGFGALALLAAATLGRSRGTAALAVAAVTVVLGLPTLAGTQPGQASNDVMAAALLLTGIALLAEGRWDPGPTVLAAAAIGVAIGTKLTVAPVAGVLAVAIVSVAWRRRGWRVAAAATGALGLVGAFWFARNWALAGNPLPFVEVSLGPLHLPATVDSQPGTSLVSNLHDLRDQPDWYLTGLTRGLGPVWPLVLLVAAAGVLLAARDRGLGRLIAAALSVGAAVYPFMPLTGGLMFGFNLRYLMPVAMLAAGAVGWQAGVLGRRGRTGLLICLLAVGGAGLFADHHERVPAWPGHWWLAALVVVAVPAATAIWLGVQRPHALKGSRRIGAATAALALVVAAGWPVQRSFIEHRYRGAGLEDDVLNIELLDVSHATVDVLGNDQVYPFFGNDLTNRVRDRSNAMRDAPEPGPSLCRYWRSLLSPGDRYLVLSSYGFLIRPISAVDRQLIFESDSAVDVVFVDGDRAVLRVEGELDPGLCEQVSSDG